MKNYQDLSGCTFGRLKVIERAEDRICPNGNHEIQWLCECNCSNHNRVIVRGYSLKNGDTKSCGCLQKELLSKRVKKHGKSNERVFWIWCDIKLRCYNENTRGYNRYGGRGITVCDEWLNDFQAFNDWAMANGYRDDLTIDRIDNNKGYSPDNCRWATPKEQANNRCNNRILEYKGKKQTMKQWAEELNINYSTLKMRINAYHWSVEKALTTPTQKHKVG